MSNYRSNFGGMPGALYGSGSYGGGGFGGMRPPPRFDGDRGDGRGIDRDHLGPSQPRPEPAGPELEFKSLNANKADLGVPRALTWNQRGDKLAFASDSALRIYNPSAATASPSPSSADPAEKTYQPTSGYRYVDVSWDRQRPGVIFALQEGKSSSGGGLLSQIDTRTHKSTDSKVRADKPFNVLPHPDGNLVAVHVLDNTYDDAIHVYDIRGSKGTLVHHIPGIQGPIYSPRWAPDGSSIMFGTGEYIQLVSFPSMEISTPFRCHRGIKNIATDKKGKLIATSGSGDGMICFWDAATMAPTSSVYRHNFPALSLALSPDASLAAYCIDDTSLTRANPTREEMGVMGSEMAWWNDHLSVCEQRGLTGPFLEICSTSSGQVVKHLPLCIPPRGGNLSNNRAAVAEKMSFDPTGKVLAFTLHNNAQNPRVQPFGRMEKDIGLLTVS